MRYTVTTAEAIRDLHEKAHQAHLAALEALESLLAEAPDIMDVVMERPIPGREELRALIADTKKTVEKTEALRELLGCQNTYDLELKAWEAKTK